jgi:hypothetical protein
MKDTQAQPYIVNILGSCDPEIWDALIYFSEKRYKEALGVVEEARTRFSASQEYWHMAFDLCHLSNDTKLMDKLTSMYAMQFGILPPSMAENTDVPDESGSAAGKSCIQLNILTMSKPESESYKEIFNKSLAQKSPLNVFCDGIKKPETMTMAEEASARMVEGLSMLLGQKIPVYFEGNAIQTKINSIAPEKRKDSEWDLFFLMLQLMDKQSVFEEAAIEYAITKGISPPSWVPVSQPKKEKSLIATVVDGDKQSITEQRFNGGHLIVVNGSLTSSIDMLAKSVMSRIASNNTLVADFRSVRHACWNSSHKLVLLHNKLLDHKKRLMVLEPTPMVREILIATGLPEHSFVTKKKM